MSLKELREKYLGKQIVLDLNDYECDCDFVVYWKGKRLNDPDFDGGNGVLSLGMESSPGLLPFYEFTADRNNCLTSIEGRLYEEKSGKVFTEVEEIWGTDEYESGSDFFEAVTSWD